MNTIRPALALAFPLALIACGEPAVDDQQDATRLEADPGNGNAGDPALNAALAGQIMVDPTLTQSSNDDAIRPPPEPMGGAMPPEEAGRRADTVDPRTLKRAPAAAGDCPACRTADAALTLGALAERQTFPNAATCARTIGYSALWANSLPDDLQLYPDAQLSEAAGSDQAGCRLPAARRAFFESGDAAAAARLLLYPHRRHGLFSRPPQRWPPARARRSARRR